jgi:hypothetical protein
MLGLRHFPLQINALIAAPRQLFAVAAVAKPRRLWHLAVRHWPAARHLLSGSVRQCAWPRRQCPACVRQRPALTGSCGRQNNTLIL